MLAHSRFGLTRHGFEVKSTASGRVGTESWYAVGSEVAG